MTPADRQLIEWCHARGIGSLKTSLAIGYLQLRALGREPTPKLKRECEAALEQLRIHRAHEIALEVSTPCR